MSDQSKYISKLHGAKILIIGGSSGIGYGVSEASVEHGATVIISSSNKDRIYSAVSRLQEAYPSAVNRISGEQLDIGDPEKIEQNLKRVLDKCGKLDHIVMTAADSLVIKPIAELDVATIYKAGTTRFLAPLILAKLAPQYLKPGPASSITLTTGSVSERPIPNWTLINSYATGLHGMTRGLALDLKPIRVNLVSPGAVDTPLWTQPEDEKRRMLQAMAKGMTTGRVGEVEDVAESYVYLMKDKNISGAIISTSGGSLLVGPAHS